MSSSNYEMRRSLVWQDGKLRLCQRRNVSCFNWLVVEEHMDITEFMNTVHGAWYPGRVYFYKGLDNTTTDEEVERVAELCRGHFNGDTEICCGAIPGKEGTMWEPIKKLGYGTSMQ